MIKKIIPILASASFMMLPVISHADMIAKPEGWYLKGAWQNMFDPSNSGGSGSIGFKKYNFRLEGQYSYLHESFRDYGIRENWIPKKKNPSYLSLSGYYDFDNPTIFSPYIGVGIERTFNKLRFQSIDATNHTVKGVYRDYYRGIATVGLRSYISQNVAIDFGYKFINFNTKNFVLGGSGGSLGLVYHF